MRPSCGSRFSAMFSRDMIFRRLTIADVKLVDLRRHRLHSQQAVDAVADHQPLLLRLDVHVARLLLERFDQHFVDQLDDRRCLRHLGQFAELIGQLVEQFDALFGALRDQFADRVAADAEIAL